MLPRPVLCIHTQNGKEFFSKEFVQPTREPTLGSFRRIPLTDEQLTLSLDELSLLYKKDQALAAVTASEQDATETPEEKFNKRMHLVKTIIAVIHQSNQPGEVDAARVAYKKLMGKDYIL